MALQLLLLAMLKLRMSDTASVAAYARGSSSQLRASSLVLSSASLLKRISNPALAASHAQAARASSQPPAAECLLSWPQKHPSAAREDGTGQKKAGCWHVQGESWWWYSSTASGIFKDPDAAAGLHRTDRQSLCLAGHQQA